MKKQLTNTVNYDINPDMKLKIVNKPIVDIDTGEQFGYDVKVSLTYKAGIKEKQLSFANAEEIAEFVCNLDFDEPQQALALGI